MAVDGLACILWALLLLTLPLNWLLAALCAAAVHELCHYAAARLLGGRAGDLRIGPGGAVLDISGLTAGEELLCALAGPLGGLLCVGLYRVFPRLALCALLQSAYNLLPIYPLDGGRGLFCLLRLLLPERRAVRLCLGVEVVACCLLLAASVALGRGLLPVLFALWVILRALGRKIPCIAPNLGVQ